MDHSPGNLMGLAKYSSTLEIHSLNLVSRHDISGDIISSSSRRVRESKLVPVSMVTDEDAEENAGMERDEDGREGR